MREYCKRSEHLGKGGVGLQTGDLLFYAGAAIMVFTVLLALIYGIVFRVNGKKIKEQLLEEYGEPWKYHL